MCSWDRRMRRIQPFYFIATLLLFCLPFSSAIWPFPDKRYTGNALLSAGSLGLDSSSRVIAFGDFNGDQFLDLLSVGSDQQTLSVYLWDHAEYTFTLQTQIRHPSPIMNVVPGDFTYDGKLDLLVMSETPGSDHLALSLYAGIHSGYFNPSPIPIPSSSPAQPIPLDANGDMKIDLLGFGSPTTTRTGLTLWKNTWNTSNPKVPLFELVDPPFSTTSSRCESISNPHSNAVVDLNGDCLADVFLVCDAGSGNKYFQIWINDPSGLFTLSQSGSLPSGTLAVSFADMDRDGTIDMVFPTCDSVSSTTGVGSNCYLNIAYNHQLPLCASSTTPSVENGVRVCRPPEDLCTADSNFSFDFSSRTRIPLSSLFSTSGLLVSDTSHNPPLPLSFKVGDANLDGFPDLLAIVANGNERIPELILSVPCGKGVAGCENGSQTRGWQAVKHGAEALTEVLDARGVSFIDTDEDGSLDIMVQRTGDQGEGTILFVQNNFYYDAFFLKAIVLNGACADGWCMAPNGSKLYQPFGVSYSGATYKYTVLDTTGQRSAAQVGQLAQTAYHSLLTPYSFFGLGRTNNYIENLFVGSTKHSSEYYINMEGVIPNSKVVINPPPADRVGSAWKRELYLRPGEWIPWVTVTVVVATIILAVIVFVLHLNEKREDELERRRTSHVINFDAL